MENKALVSIIMGSSSDMKIMKEVSDFLETMAIPFELTVVSAHRTPERMMHYASQVADRGIRVVVAGAGGAAHLPGMVASLTTLPVIGVPIHSSNSIDGWDSILSILQMPSGIPVATVALNGGKNAGILAARILGASHDGIREKLKDFKEGLTQKVMESLVSLHSFDYTQAIPVPPEAFSKQKNL